MSADDHARPGAPASRPLAASRFWFRRPFFVLLAALAAYYLVCYALSDERPGGAFLGWRGWADQGEYLKSIRAFASGNWDPSQYLYPPLYALASAPFWPLLHWHATLVPDLVFFLIAFGTVLAVSRRFYGSVLPVMVCVALFAFAPIMSIKQWVIPWTSSASAALASMLILFYARSEAAAEPFRLTSRRDWILFALCFLAYGALAMTRPLDTVVWLPFALALFLRTAWATVTAASGAGRRILILLAIGALAAGAALVCVTGYLGFNERMFGTLFGPYAASTLGHGYFADRIPERLFSFLWDSGAAFAEPGHALFQRFPLFGPILAVCLVTLLTTTDLRFWIIATAFLNFLIYLPYGDLLPNGFFRYYNLHYFKWAYPWLAVIAVGQVVSWTRSSFGKRRGWAPLLAAALVTLIGWALRIEPVNLTLASDLRTTDHAIAVVAPHPRQVEFIDIPNASGGFTTVYQGSHKLWIDGREVLDFRLLPTASGVRVLLLEPQVMSLALLRPDPAIKIEPGPHQSMLGDTRIVTAVAYHPYRADVAWSGGRIDFDFRPGGNMHDVPLDPVFWWNAETGGRWTIAHQRSPLDFKAQTPAGDVYVRSTVLPLHNRRSWGFRPRVSLWVNGCLIARKRIDQVAPHVLEGVVPARCLKRDGDIKVEWGADHPRSPRSLHMAGDDRVLGVAVSDLALVQAGRGGKS